MDIRTKLQIPIRLTAVREVYRRCGGKGSCVINVGSPEVIELIKDVQQR
jgi:hypothetical protein